MRILEFTSMPKLDFAHIFQSEKYNINIPKSENTMEILYISKGCIQCRGNDSLLILNEGDILCSIRDKEYVATSDEFHCHHTTGFSVDFKASDDISEGLIIPEVISANTNMIRAYNIIDTFIHNTILYKSNRAKTAALFFELMCEFDRIGRKINREQIPGHIRYAQMAKEYIQRNVYSPITQNAIAEYLGISPGYLCNIFKKTEGVSLMKYINKIKLENVKHLIDTTGIRLYEAAEMYGYADPNYASRLYKQIFGYNITNPSKKIKKY